MRGPATIRPQQLRALQDAVDEGDACERAIAERGRFEHLIRQLR
jgi:hypothetical protein